MRDLWISTCAKLDMASSDRDAIFACISALHAFPPRAYHNLAHVAAMLSDFKTVPDHADNPTHVELAIWFHDCIYDPKASDNEERSADVADTLLRHALPSADERAVLGRLILATRHDGRAATTDEKWLVDLDLAMLGETAASYDTYARAIRRSTQPSMMHDTVPVVQR